MEKTFAVVGALCALMVAGGIAIAAIIFASQPPAPVNVYLDGQRQPLRIEPVPAPQPYRPYQPYYPHRPGNNETGARGDTEATKTE